MTDKEQRKEYRIKPKIGFEIDERYKMFFFIPTIIWQPWKYRWDNSFVISVHWLIFAIGVGRWERKELK